MNKIQDAVFMSVILLAMSGCSSSGTSPADETKLKQQFAKKNFDINDVPANERQMVQGFIDRNKKMAAQGKPIDTVPGAPTKP
jgi:hypothetical protein